MPAPYPLLTPAPGDLTDWFFYPSKSMNAAHNLFLSGFNSMVVHAAHVSGDKIKPFVFFCLSILESLHHHHTIEEEYYFPELEKKLGKGAMEGPLSQHDMFVPQLEQLREWLKEVYVDKTAYDGRLLLSRVNEFSDIMFQHLNEEVKFLAPEKLKAAFTQAELKVIEDEFVRRSLKEAKLTVNIPCALVCVNPHPEEAWFPPIPAPIKWLARWVLYFPHRESWEFGACDLNGNPKVMPNVPEAVQGERGDPVR